MIVSENTAYEFRGFYIPERMMISLKNYVENHISTGHFLRAIISNNLIDAVERADDENLRNIPAYVGYLYNEAPAECWGSDKAYQAWISQR